MLSDSSEDRDTEEALKEFDFLVTSDDGDAESRSSGDGTDWGKEVWWIIPGEKKCAKNVLWLISSLNEISVSITASFDYFYFYFYFIIDK